MGVQGSARRYLAAFASLHELADLDERRRVARQGLAVLAQIAEREPAPLEGLAPEMLLVAVRTSLGDGVLADLEWMSPAAGALALFELAQALPPGAERRELRRRVLLRLRDADRDTFVRLLVTLARSAPKLVASDSLRARAEVVLSAPLTGSAGAIGELAIGLCAQPELAVSWIEEPAMGSLPARRLAARILAHGAREAMRRHDAGDRGGVAVMVRPGIRAALERLLGDREALVWRFAAIARGLLAHVDLDLAAAIDRELRPTASSTELRRGAASAAAALERGGSATRWAPEIALRARKEPGVARGAILGLAGLAISAPAIADELANELIQSAPLDGAEALAELRREEASALLPSAARAALAWAHEQAAHAGADDGRWALLHALELELGDPQRGDDAGLRTPIAAARAALDAGDVTTALREARLAITEVTEAADWLERATDDDPVDRRHSMRLLRELDRELLADNALTAVLALAPEGDPARAEFARALGAIEAALLAREAKPETGTVAHGGLRIARLRALVRLLDGVRATGEADLGPRLAAVRTLMARAEFDHSSLRRAVWAALTRAGDALLRDGHAEITDLLLAWTMAFPDEEFAIVREASMIPEVTRAFEAYAELQSATWAASDPDDTDAIRSLVERLGELADALPPEQSPRVESVRLALARTSNLAARITAAHSRATVPDAAIEALAVELAAIARRVFGAQQRLGLETVDREAELEGSLRAVGASLARESGKDEPAIVVEPPRVESPLLGRTRTRERIRPAAASDHTTTTRIKRDTLRDSLRGLALPLDEAIGLSLDAIRSALPPALGGAIERILLWLARRPRADDAKAQPAATEPLLPSWVPLSRLLGGFHVVRPIGRGAGGSVLLACRAEERSRPDRELVALKTPDYSGGAARNLSEQEFEAMFRDEASALLALPAHANLAGFVTFDASAKPKPILVMEYVRGTNLERTLEHSTLDVPRAFALIDDLLAGLVAMHEVSVAHLDVKPANVVLRDGSGVAVLVDFGLAGRRLRTGCGSVHYGAREVWAEDAMDPPFPADVYAAACVAFEVLTNAVLVRGDSLNDVVANHFSKQPAAAVLATLERLPRLGPLAELLRAATARDSSKRPTAARLRAGFAAIAPDLRSLAWPIDV